MNPRSAVLSICSLGMASCLEATESLSLNAPADPYRVSMGISTFGYTLNASYRFHENWAIRGLAAYGEIETKMINEGFQASGRLFGMEIQTDFPIGTMEAKPQSITGGYGILLDYYPGEDSFWGKGFRASFGAMGTIYEISAHAVVDDYVRMHRTWERVLVHDIEAKMDIPGIFPYAGIGYDFAINNNWAINLDAGVMFNVKYDGYMRGTALHPEDQAEVDAALQREMNLKLEELEPYPFLPYIFIGASYRF